MLTKDSVLKDLERLIRYASKNKLDKPCYMFNSNLGLKLRELGDVSPLPTMLLDNPILYNEYLGENVVAFGSVTDCDKTIDYTLKNHETGVAWNRFINDSLEANRDLVNSTVSLCYIKLRD